MKKLLVLLIALSLSTINVFAQNTPTEEEHKKSESKTLEFMESSGFFIQKEYFYLSSINGVEYEVLVITNLMNGNKMGCLTVTTTNSSSYSTDEYVGTLDYDEIDACIQCLTKLQDEILPSIPTVYTELEYKTRDGVKIGAYYDTNKAKWYGYVYTKDYTSRSLGFFKDSNIPTIINVMNQAKAMIMEKTKV